MQIYHRPFTWLKRKLRVLPVCQFKCTPFFTTLLNFSSNFHLSTEQLKNFVEDSAFYTVDLLGERKALERCHFVKSQW